MYYPAQIVFHADSDICVISDALPTRHCLHKSIMSYQINSEKCHSRKLIYYGFTSYYYYLISEARMHGHEIYLLEF